MKSKLDGTERQADLFSLADAARSLGPARRSRPMARSTPARGDPPASATPSLVEMAAALEQSDDYRVLRRLVPRPVVPFQRSAGSDTRIGVIVDTETTGLDHARDEIIELGMVAFTYRGDAIGDVIGVFSALREPSIEISAAITRITGITAEMVRGKCIDVEAVACFIRDADIVIAHNAKFDRPFCERLVPDFEAKPWACSVSEVDWTALGFEGTKLGYLVGQCGWFHNGHRAVDDCHALLEVLASPAKADQHDPFAQMIASARRTRLRLWAEGSPFHAKDALKERGYRWSDGSAGRPKCWWVDLDESAYDDELAFLQKEVYRREVDLPVERLTARERFKA